MHKGNGKKTQNDKILEYMKNHGSITALEAVRNFGCLRLAARISDLRKMGNVIDRELIMVPTRDGKTRVAEYSLRSDLK